MDMMIEPAELRDTAQKLLAKAVGRRAAYGDVAGDKGAALRALMAEQGWMLLTTPNELDGLGQSFHAVVPIYEELGRALASVAFAGTMAAVEALTLVGTAESGEWLSRIGAGEVTIAVAAGDELSFDGNIVSGTLSGVWEGGQATHLLVVPDRGEAPLAIIDLSAPDVVVTELAVWDRTRTIADIALSGAEAAVLLEASQSQAAGQAVRAHLDLAIACDSLGGADACLADAIAYMGTRQQFNRPIGSFQALKHRSADLKVGLEIARALTNDACNAFVDRREDWTCAAAKAKLLAAGAYRAVAEESVQFHGGIGFTWEHDCHLFLKRALLNEMLGGTPEEYKDRLAPDVLRRAMAGRSVAQ